MIRLIVAVDQKLGLSKKGFQPWYIPNDEAYFTKLTKLHGGRILVGKTTYKTFGQPLSDRKNYVLSRNPEPIEGVTVVNDLNEFLGASKNEDLWVIGGAEVFKLLIQDDKVDELYMTHIEADFGCDKHFPSYKEGFILRKRSQAEEQNGFGFSYAVYDRSARPTT